MEIILKKPLWFTVITTLCLVVVTLFGASGCDKSENSPKTSNNVSFTPCQQSTLRSSSDFSERVDVEFTSKGVQITYHDFEVTCDFTTVNVTHTFVNGVLRITQQGYPNQADCVCHSDVSYTIEGISQDEVNVIFINGVQIYCYNDNNESENTNGIIVGYIKCNVDNDDLIGLFIITEKKDSLLSFNVPLPSINVDSNALIYGAHNLDGGSINFDYKIAVGEEIKQNFLCPQNSMLPGFSHGQTENYKQIIITDIK